ncbi:MAG: tRNA pseudouridine(38-40) synthase TruA [Paludibacteraceae bacterium]|nr:tRNA pseudouridine(38-40) synthase TruA [Paludibacteraceae bacterium]
MMRYFIHLAYNGAEYHGWQNQPNAITVQEAVERALSLILKKEKISITGAGRTDSGVHARSMYAHFNIDEAVDTQWLTERLNAYLPKDIVIFSVYEVEPDMHARFSAKSRTYRYYVTTQKDPFEGIYRMKVSPDTNFAAMNRAAEHLFRFIDFTSFSKLHTDVKTNNCHVIEAHWDQTSETHWTFTITADRFLRNMVRAIVGTLLEVGAGKISEEQFAEIIEKKDRRYAGTSVPAKALFLEEVRY